MALKRVYDLSTSLTILKYSGKEWNKNKLINRILESAVGTHSMNFISINFSSLNSTQNRWKS